MLVTVLQRVAREEAGGMFVLFALLLTVLLLVAAFVIDIGNWFEHRRHLQTQTYNGALASARLFSGCLLDPVQVNEKIDETARQYAGDPGVPGSYNRQVDDPSRVSLRLNSASYPPAGADYDTDWNTTTDDDIESSPCDAKLLDVKARDSGIPSLFGHLLPEGVQRVDINAHARVEIRQVLIHKGFLPWAVPEFNPKHAYAIFIDEAAGADPTPIVSVELFRQDSDTGDGEDPPDFDDYTLNGQNAALWKGLGAVEVAPRTGVIIMTTRLNGPILGGSVSAICGQAQTQCFAGQTSGTGVGFIHGYPAAPPAGPTGTPNSPILRDVTLGGAGCKDDSAPYFAVRGSCDVSVRAVLDFGPDPDTSDLFSANMPPDPVSKGGLKAEVWALGPGCPPQGCEMRFVGSGWDGLWETTATLPRLPDPEDNKKDEGRQDFEIKWKTATGGDTFANVHHPYIADEKSGPVVYMKLTKPDTTYANSLQVGSRTVQIDVGIAPPLKPAEAGEPPILLRFGSKAGSLNQMIDCDFKAQPADEIRDGCQQSYQINRRGGSCPPWLKNNLPYDPDKSYSETPFPPDCVEANPGDVTSMATGLQARFVTPAPPRVGCPPNRWQEFRLQGKLPPDNDPRYVTLTVTDFGQFDSSGLAVVPVRVFAGFYITGWFESSQVDTCADNDPPPPPICGTKSQWPPPDPDTVDGCDPAHKDNQGNVWGYFVTNVIEAPAGSESQELCEFDELGICLGVLTR